MEIKQFIDTRFLVPPIITVFFIWLVDPFVFFDYFKNYEGYEGIVGFLTSTAFILALGFLISSFVTVIINIIGVRDILKEHQNELVLPDFLDPSQNIDREVTTWLAILDDAKNEEEKLKLDYIRKQIHKRWHACNANFNCVAALIASAAILLLYLNWSPSCAWWVIWIISIVLFVINGRYAYQDVKSIDIIMVKRKKWLPNKYGNKK